MKVNARIVLLSFLVVLMIVPLVAVAKTKSSPAKPMAKSMEDLTWMDHPDVPGAKMAVLWGDPAKGPSGVMQRWPAGTHQPRHYHSASVRGIGISGHLTVTMDDKSIIELKPGSYGRVPAGTRHVTHCSDGAECVFVTYILGKADTKYTK